MIIPAGEIDEFRRILNDLLGLHFDDSAQETLTDVLAQRLSARAIRSPDYLRSLRTGEADDELRELAQRLTVSETYFFRYPEQFQALAEVAIPKRLAAHRNDREMEILSAGCASGEEPYSIAMLLRTTIPDLESWRIGLLGIDINTQLLEKARKGVYTPWSLRAMPEEYRTYFEQTGKAFTLDQRVRQLVNFQEKNLVEDDSLFWWPGRFDIIFCRNITIYFSEATTRTVIERLTNSLAPGGFLFLGPTETLRGISHAYHLRHTHGIFYYQKRGADEAAIVPEPKMFVPARATAPILPDDTRWLNLIEKATQRIGELRIGTNGKAGRGSGADLKQAIKLVGEERFDEALKALPRADEKDPDALLVRAVILANAGQIEEAEQICKQVLEIDELCAPAHYLMALCKEHAGQEVAAAEYDQTAIYLAPAFAMPRMHLGLLAKRTGDLQTARNQLQEAIVLLEREDPWQLLLFGGGFNRETLIQLCRGALRAAEENL